MKYLIVAKLKKQKQQGGKYFFLSDKDYERYIDEMSEFNPKLTGSLVKGSSAVLSEDGVFLTPAQQGIPLLFYCGLPVFRKRYKKLVKSIYGEIV